jgi:hypothetical protein
MLPQQQRMLRPSAARAGTVRPLRDALRRARMEAAERTESVIAVRDAEIARLELVKDALEPVIQDVPEDVDIFDLGIVPGERPRLFIDMVAHVGLADDRRTYRFLRDARTGRQVLAENQDPKLIAAAVTSYIARRLVEREQILAQDRLEGPLPLLVAEEQAADSSASELAAAPADSTQGKWLQRLAILCGFLLGALLGAGLFVALR